MPTPLLPGEIWIKHPGLARINSHTTSFMKIKPAENVFVDVYIRFSLFFIIDIGIVTRGNDLFLINP